jgi:tRNA (guanosine-2'-O-)-methyltransferase
LHELDITRKTALVFGNELDGLSPTALQQADAYVKIPMVGFTESLNISVSAAVCMSQLAARLRASDIDWSLKEEERTDILIQWIKNTLKYPENVEKEYIFRQSLSGSGK